jgi:hypothetical protein
MNLKKITLVLLVFTTSQISLAQTYTDHEIGLDSARYAKKLITKGYSIDNISGILSQERQFLTDMYEEYLDDYLEFNTENPPPQSQNSSCNVPPSERQALVDLYNSTNSLGWTNDWDISTPVCDWYGVTVSNNHVVVLKLNNNNLHGLIPPSIGDLTYLQNLNFDVNYLESPIPSTVSNLTNLVSLYLRGNNFDGPIPDVIGNLSNLKVLSLTSNLFNGEIPSNLSNLSSIESFYVNGNELEGFIPSFIYNLTTLERLYLGNNNLEGGISNSINNLVNLKDFSIRFNYITGIITPSVGQISGLRILFLGWNELTGEIPLSIENLNNLSILEVRKNKLNGNIPSGLVNINSFSILYFEDNKFIFSDFENEHISYDTNLSTYYFAPQAKVDQIETITVTEGDPIVFNTILSSPNNSYQWLKDNALFDTTTNNVYTIPSASESDEGVYYFEATNSVVQGLTLERHPITVIVEPAGNGGNPNDSCNCNSFAPNINKKYVLSGWVKEEITNFSPVTPEDRLVLQPLTYENSSVEVVFYDSNGAAIGGPLSFNPTGEIIDGWQRIVGEFTIPFNAVDIGLDLVSSNPNDSNLEIVSYFDDVRFHPFNGNMKSFVYDSENYRLMAELDENNFATFYEYDNEGGLIRVKKETERGVMTIQETRSGNKVFNNGN